MSEEIAMSAYKKAKTADGKADANAANIANLTQEVESQLADIKSCFDGDKVLIDETDMVSGMYTDGATFRSDGVYGYGKTSAVYIDLNNDEIITINASATLPDVANVGLYFSRVFYDADYETARGNSAWYKITDGTVAENTAAIMATYTGTRYLRYNFAIYDGATFYPMASDFLCRILGDNIGELMTRITNLENALPIANGICITVNPNGGANYETLTEAVAAAEDSYANGIPATIFVYPGVYDEVLDIGGSRNLSIIGMDRDHCIIKNTTGLYTHSPIHIDGNFTLENLTLMMTDENKPSGWTPGTSQSDEATMLPGYALHVDGGRGNLDAPAVGTIRNCTLYSEVFSALGLGLHQHQKIILENCIFERNIKNTAYNYVDYQGALLVHDTTQAIYYLDQNIIIRNCYVKCNLGYSASIIFKYTSPADVTLTAINNAFWSDETGTPNVLYTKNASVLHGMSYGNNDPQLNA